MYQDVADQEPFKSTVDAEARKKLVQELHLLKTDIFMELVESGAMPLRPGVRRLVSEWRAPGGGQSYTTRCHHLSCHVISWQPRNKIRNKITTLI